MRSGRTDGTLHSNRLERTKRRADHSCSGVFDTSRRAVTMNATDYQLWLKTSFLYVEAALATELATPSRICITEELVRTSLVRGLSHTRPPESRRIRVEYDTSFAQHECIFDANHRPTRGRRLQHDVAIARGADANGDDDAGAVIEVKWLKNEAAPSVAQDIWKLALAVGSENHRQATRAFLLIGGDTTRVTGTFNTLRDSGVDFRWSKAGATKGLPQPRPLKVGDFFAYELGRTSLKNLLSWGAPRPHFRRPPDCRYEYRVKVSGQWLRRVKDVSWCAALWEITGFKAKADVIDWQRTIPQQWRTC